MLHLAPPERITAEIHARLPDKFRNKRRTAWSEANRGGGESDSFIEGPSFDRDGNLYFTDIPFGRIFRLAPSGEIELIIEYEGWPNGLKIHKDGRICVTDHKRGLMLLDPVRGRIEPLLESRHSEGFKGLNDLHFANNGDLYFTDQGQTGLHDPTGRVYRLTAGGRLEQLIATVPSPNGLVLNLTETQLWVAVTRANAVWRLPLMADGSTAKVGTYIQMSGGYGGPDGMALDDEGALLVCHLGTGVWRFDRKGMPTHIVEGPEPSFITNVAFGGPHNRYLFMTDSESGSILRAEMPVPGRRLFSHQD
ncbi:MAG: SMP-30/gluconolactonase/LRE family protein [Acetobacteraceae bacterium]|nr:SMP-30/gluconolactonase/LRE family protein [Acetobacteraceae bacterium]